MEEGLCSANNLSIDDPVRLQDAKGLVCGLDAAAHHPTKSRSHLETSTKQQERISQTYLKIDNRPKVNIDVLGLIHRVLTVPFLCITEITKSYRLILSRRRERQLRKGS